MRHHHSIRLSVVWSIILLGFNILAMVQIAHAQYGSANSTVTAEILEECKELGVKPEQCSEATILAKKRCSGPNCGTETPPPTLDPTTLSTMIASAIALGIGVFVGKIGKVKKRS